MQRKTKFKIIFYSIGFISFALLPYVITKQDAAQDQRYAQLPSYDNADTVHPFLTKLKKSGSSLADLFRKRDAATTSQTAQGVSADSVEALKQAAEKEVLASLSPKTTAATATKTLASSATPTAGSAPSAMAASGEEPPQAAGAEPAPEELKNQALFAPRPATARTGFPNRNDTRNVLNQKGYSQSAAPANNNVYARSKNGALEDLIAQSDSRLARTLWNNYKNRTQTARKGGGKSSSKSKSSSKAQFKRAKSALKNAAVARAKAKQYSYGHAGTPIGAVPVTDAQVQYEMMLQNQELNSIFTQQAAKEIEEETRANPVENTEHQLQNLLLYRLTDNVEQEKQDTTSSLPTGESNSETGKAPPIPTEGEGSQQIEGYDSFMFLDNDAKDVIVVLDIAQKDQEGNLDFYTQTDKILEDAEQQQLDANTPDSRKIAEKIQKRRDELNAYNNNFTSPTSPDSDHLYYAATLNPGATRLKNVATEAGYMLKDVSGTPNGQNFALASDSDLNQALENNETADENQDNKLTYIYPSTMRVYEHLMKNLDNTKELFYFVIKPQIDYDELESDSQLAASIRAEEAKNEAINAMNEKSNADISAVEAEESKEQLKEMLQNGVK
jgi:hypothetical protein